MTAAAPSPALFAMLAFNAGNQLAVRKLGSKHGLAFTGSDLAMATARLESSFPKHTPPAEYFTCAAGCALETTTPVARSPSRGRCR